MSIVLDVAIGITFLYLLLSLLVTTLQEFVASLLSLRAKNLYAALEGMLVSAPGDKTLLDEVYKHPLIKNLRDAKFRKPKELNLPSYIPSKTFAVALLDVLRQKSKLSDKLGATTLMAGARQGIEQLEGHEDLKRVLSLVMEEAGTAATRVDQEAALITAGVETWFNDRMSRASGWYKRKAQRLALLLALGVTLGSNCDSIHVASELWSNGALRDTIAAGAQSFYDKEQARAAKPAPSEAPLAGTTTDPKQAAADVQAAVNDLRNAKLPIGWTIEWPPDCPGWLLRILGWLITTLAVSLGSGFWFDALGKALGIRKTGPKISAATGRVEGQD